LNTGAYQTLPLKFSGFGHNRQNYRALSGPWCCSATMLALLFYPMSPIYMPKQNIWSLTYSFSERFIIQNLYVKHMPALDKVVDVRKLRFEFPRKNT